MSFLTFYTFAVLPLVPGVAPLVRVSPLQGSGIGRVDIPRALPLGW